MITKLCQNARVEWTSKEEVRAPKGVIDDAVVMKIHDDDKAASRPTRVGSISQPRPRTIQD